MGSLTYVATVTREGELSERSVALAFQKFDNTGLIFRGFVRTALNM